MAQSKKQLALHALHSALQLRIKHGIGISEPVDIFDFCSKIGLEVRFVDYSSMEGMYVKREQPMILISSLRPPGRQRFNCAHELGHYIFEHGTKIDEYLDQSKRGSRRYDPEEYLADQFASCFLMPKSLVNHAFQIRNWVPNHCQPTEFYSVSCYLGVGYSTLITHMNATLGILSNSEYDQLIAVTPKGIKSQILGCVVSENLVVVDFEWKGRAVDIEVGDFIVLPPYTQLEGENISLVSNDSHKSVYQGLKPGTSRMFHLNQDWAAYVRVSRRNYTGRCIFRHLEDPEYE